MGTTADKLQKLADTKADLKAALAEKGQTVGDVFSEYPAAVRAISSGGELVTGTINSGKGAGKFYYSDGEEFKNTSSGTVSVLKNTFVYVFYDLGISVSGDISTAESSAYTYKVTGPFTVSFR